MSQHTHGEQFITYDVVGMSITAYRFTYHSFTPWREHPWGKSSNLRDGRNFQDEWTVEYCTLDAPNAEMTKWRQHGRSYEAVRMMTSVEATQKLQNLINNRVRILRADLEEQEKMQRTWCEGYEESKTEALIEAVEVYLAPYPDSYAQSTVGGREWTRGLQEMREEMLRTAFDNLKS